MHIIKKYHVFVHSFTYKTKKYELSCKYLSKMLLMRQEICLGDYPITQKIHHHKSLLKLKMPDIWDLTYVGVSWNS